MNRLDPSFQSVWPLIEAACLGTITEEQSCQLQDRLRGDAALQRDYLEYCRMHAELRYLCRASATNDAILEQIASEAEPVPPSTSFPGGHQTTPSFFSEQPVLFSYLVATVIIVAAAAIGSLIHVSRDAGLKVAHDERIESPSSPSNRTQFVGRITGMKDCRWSEDGTVTIVGASVSLNRRYALASGLLEITYKSGARVILEGPCTYKVDSEAGGFLTRGKLTARVETKGSGFRGQGSEVRGQRTEVRNQKSPNPQSLVPNPFFVRTPTAIITDLGTEFGVEVDENGDTTSYVFQGSIKVQGLANAQGLAASAASGDARNERVLHKNESIRVSRVRETHHEPATGGTGLASGTQVRFTHPTETPKFVRRMPEPPPVVYLNDTFDSPIGSKYYNASGGYGLNKNLELRQKGLYQRIFYVRGGDGVQVPSSIQVSNPRTPGKLSFHVDGECDCWLVLNHNFPRNATLSASLMPAEFISDYGTDELKWNNTNTDHWIALGMLGQGISLNNRDLTKATDAGAVFQIRANGRWSYYEDGKQFSEGRVAAASAYQVNLHVWNDRLSATVNGAAIDLDPVAPDTVRILPDILQSRRDNYISISSDRSDDSISAGRYVVGTVDNLIIQGSRPNAAISDGKEDAANK